MMVRAGERSNGSPCGSALPGAAAGRVPVRWEPMGRAEFLQQQCRGRKEFVHLEEKATATT